MQRRRRIEIAEHAARLLLAGEAPDWQGARRKALQAFPDVLKEDQPDAIEIEQALAVRRRLFRDARHPLTLRRKREAALQAMRLLREFEPRLSGPVFSGTAVQTSAVELHLFADRGEDVSMFLTDRGIPHDLRDLPLTLRDGRRQRYPVCLFEAGEDAFELIIFPLDDLRRPAPMEPGEHRPMARGDQRAVERLLSQTVAAND